METQVVSKVHNFSAGPGILPQEVLKQASEAVRDFNGIGLSLLEISHRSKDFVAVMDEAQALVKQLLNLGDDYEVLFLQGGASTQFTMVPHNLLSSNGYAAYVNTGAWAKKAIKESQILGDTKVLATSEDANFNYIPKNVDIPADADYFHFTSNNTIYGTQYQEFPNSETTLVCDMSSDIFSRNFDASNFGLIYAGAQKNMGPAGTTLVIVRKDILGKVDRTIPTMLKYSTHIEKESMFNTPPVFPIYVSMLTLKWLVNNGGLSWIENVNKEKANLIYNEIDRNPLFKGTAATEDRSRMNVTFVLNDDSKTDAFNELLTEANISGLKGHRSVGGFRASIYNAMPKESVQVLVDVMQRFEQIA